MTTEPQITAIFEALPAPVLVETARDLAERQLALTPWHDDDAVREALARWDDDDAPARWEALARATEDPTVGVVATLRRALRHGGRERVLLEFLAARFERECVVVFALAAQPHLEAWWASATNENSMELLLQRLDRAQIVRLLVDRAQTAVAKAARVPRGAHEALTFARAWLDGTADTAQCAAAHDRIFTRPRGTDRARTHPVLIACDDALSAAAARRRVDLIALTCGPRQTTAARPADALRARFTCPSLEPLVQGGAPGAPRHAATAVDWRAAPP